MAAHNDLGRKGETWAKNFLLGRGYVILETNWRFSRAEVDIIARESDCTLVFVEVRTRSSDFYGPPEDSVSLAKQQLLAEAAAAYMRSIQHDWTIRFDLIAIVAPPYHTYRLRHLKDAFFPPLKTSR